MKVRKPITSPPVHKVQPVKITTKGEIKLEIERRFLVKYLPKNLDQYPNERIKQGYLSTKEGTSIRIRKVGEKYYQTIKKGTGKIREEGEVEIPLTMYSILWKETKGRRLKKIRSYRGSRHAFGQPTRGQRTKSHFRTRKGKKSVGIKKKKVVETTTTATSTKGGKK